ncbi:MAG: GLUG motif-containing protein, partial [Oscillospiraceae bacterium]
NPNHCGFNGSFDGGNHKISNLKCEVTTAEESMGEGVGFFGILDADAHITDLELNNADISNRGKICAGGTGILAGISYGGKIENCAVSGTVTGLRQVGGFIGSTSCGLRLNEEELRGSIKNCSAKAQVTAKEYSGVFIGENNSCIIESCGASGSITGEKLMGDDESCGVLGGFAGRNIAAEIIDSRCECFINTKAAGRCIGSFVGLNEGNIKNSVYRLDMSLWKPAGDTPRDDLISDIRGLSKEEYYKSAKK